MLVVLLQKMRRVRKCVLLIENTSWDYCILICIWGTFYIPLLSGKLSGVISERDYVTKIALLKKTVSLFM